MLPALNRFLKSFWLKYPPLGLRKIILISISITGLLVAAKHLDSQLYSVILLIGFAFLALIIVSALVKGFYHRILEFMAGTNTYEIVDFVLPTDQNKSTRSLKIKGRDDVVLSAVSKSRSFNKKQSVFLDIVRRLFSVLYSKSDKCMVLVIGGGSYALPLTFTNIFPNVMCTVIEPMAKFSTSAQRYFYPLFDRGQERITPLNITGQKYLSNHVTTKYDFVFLDAFSDEEIVDELISPVYIKKLNLLVKRDGVVLANLYLIKKTLINLVNLINTLNNLNIKLLIILDKNNGHAFVLFSKNSRVIEKYRKLTKIGRYSIIPNSK